MKHTLRRITAGVVAVLLMSSAMASADEVLDWNAITFDTIGGQNPFAQARFAAITQAAVFEAVNAITGDFDPYLGTITAPPGASAEAAVVAAAHGVLRNYFPGRAASLDAAGASSLAAIPDGQGKDDGIAVGEAAAAALIAARASDGSAPPQFYTPPSANPGEWQTTPGCPPAGGILLQWRDVTPFAIQRSDQFRSDPPPALTSNEYRKAYDEVQQVGELNSTERPQDRTDVARYFSVASAAHAWNQAARQVSVAQSTALADNARAFALLNMAISDGLVSSMETKYHYVFWRPITAIRAGDTDGNPRTAPDPAWTPFITTPCFPSYPSAHASGSYAARTIAEKVFGPGAHDITLSHPGIPDVTLHYTKFSQMTDDIDDARVYGGIHFRFDQEAGARQGRDVGSYVYTNTLGPSHDDDQMPAVLRAQTGPASTGPQPDTTFTKITTGDLVTIPAYYWNGSWGDYDDDGYLDLFVGSSPTSCCTPPVTSVTNYLYHNNHDGTFTLVDAAKIPRITSNQHGSTWGDYDNDGHLDLIVTAGNPGIVNHNVLYHNNGDGTFTGITEGAIYTFTQSVGFHAPSFGDYDNDGFIDLFIAGHGMTNVLFHNNGDGTFTRILGSDPDVGVIVTDPAISEGRAWVDYDNDGHLDLFVSNAGTYPPVLYHNDGKGVFTSVTAGGLTDRVENAAASCWADYDNDGFLDLFLANEQQNSLYHNNGDGTFTPVTDSAVVQDVIPANSIFSGCAWGDYDNDGFIDLFVTQGDCLNPSSAECLHTPRANNFLYHNNGDGTFTKVTQGSVVTDLITQCEGASWGDYDRDGFLDLFVSQGAFTADPQTNLLYHNDGNGNAWLNVKLVGTVSNRSAIGAKVRVNAFYRGQSRWQVRQIISGDSESNQSSALNASFGLADATTIDTVRVEWPSGIVQELHDVAPRQFLTVTEPLCIGDCHGDGESTVDELLTLVKISLGGAQRSACPRGVPNNAAVDVALIIQAVNNALRGCGGR